MSAQPNVSPGSEEWTTHFGFGHNQDFDSGVAALETGDTRLAIEKFQICLASDPDPSTRERTRSYLAGCYVRLAKKDIGSSNWEFAIENLDEAVLYRPSFADARILRSIAFDHLGMTEDRQFEINFALDFNPRFALAVLHDGIIKIEFGDREQGMERINEALRIDKRLGSPTFREAMALFNSGEFAKSIVMFKGVNPVIEHDPSECVNEGNRFAHAGCWSEAEEAYRMALEIAPRFADIVFKHGRVLMELGRNDEAIARFREAVDINPRYADAYAFLGVSLRAAGHSIQAEDAFLAALSIDPGHVVALRETVKS